VAEDDSNLARWLRAAEAPANGAGDSERWLKEVVRSLSEQCLDQLRLNTRRAANDTLLD
jgi:hypothetical protein